MILRPPISTLFPYPSLFRSAHPLERRAPARRLARRRPPAQALLRLEGRLEHGRAQSRARRGDRRRGQQRRRAFRSEEHTSELQSRQYLACRLLLEKKQLHII